MIAFIEGKIEEVEFSHIVIMAGGVGYYIHTPGNLYGKVKKGDTFRIYTYQNVREDDISLFGFFDKADKELFQLLIQVSGIGPKVAINIIGAAPLDRLYESIKYEDMAFLTKLPGIGKKTAQRIVIDLKDKIKDMEFGSNQGKKIAISQEETVAQRSNISAIMRDAICALESLGYSSKEAEKVVYDLNATKCEEERLTWTVDIYIKKCLQKLM
jgi:Holliday junction DNA helicase RuvA